MARSWTRRKSTCGVSLAKDEVTIMDLGTTTLWTVGGKLKEWKIRGCMRFCFNGGARGGTRVLRATCMMTRTILDSGRKHSQQCYRLEPVQTAVANNRHGRKIPKSRNTDAETQMQVVSLVSPPGSEAWLYLAVYGTRRQWVLGRAVRVGEVGE